MAKFHILVIHLVFLLSSCLAAAVNKRARNVTLTGAWAVGTIYLELNLGSLGLDAVMSEFLKWRMRME